MQHSLLKRSAAVAAASLIPVTQILATTLDPALANADSKCARAMAQAAVCGAANKRATELMNARGLDEAATLVLDVQTGALITFAAIPERNDTPRAVAPLNVTTPVLPLSLTKLFLVASWWDRGLPDRSFDCIRSATPEKTEPMTISEMLVVGCDLPAKQMAIALRKKVGAKAVLADLERFGFGPQSESARDRSFWADLAPEWRSTLVPAASYTLLSAGTKDSEWADTFSLGEKNFVVTILHVSRFLQAVGNKGRVLSLVARKEREYPVAKPTASALPPPDAGENSPPASVSHA